MLQLSQIISQSLLPAIATSHLDAPIVSYLSAPVCQGFCKLCKSRLKLYGRSNGPRTNQRMHEEAAHQWRQTPQPRQQASPPIEYCQIKEGDIGVLYSVFMEVQRDYVSEVIIGVLGSVINMPASQHTLPEHSAVSRPLATPNVHQVQPYSWLCIHSSGPPLWPRVLILRLVVLVQVCISLSQACCSSLLVCWTEPC